MADEKDRDSIFTTVTTWKPDCSLRHAHTQSVDVYSELPLSVNVVFQ